MCFVALCCVCGCVCVCLCVCVAGAIFQCTPTHSEDSRTLFHIAIEKLAQTTIGVLSNTRVERYLISEGN